MGGRCRGRERERWLNAEMHRMDRTQPVPCCRGDRGLAGPRRGLRATSVPGRSPTASPWWSHPGLADAAEGIPMSTSAVRGDGADDGTRGRAEPELHRPRPTDLGGGTPARRPGRTGRRPRRPDRHRRAVGPDVVPFWRAVLGYRQVGDEDLLDPRGRGPSLWFQHMGGPAPSATASTSTSSCRTTKPSGCVAAAAAAGGLVYDEPRRRGGRWPTPRATRPTWPPGWAASDDRSTSERLLCSPGDHAGEGWRPPPGRPPNPMRGGRAP